MHIHAYFDQWPCSVALCIFMPVLTNGPVVLLYAYIHACFDQWPYRVALCIFMPVLTNGPVVLLYAYSCLF